MRSVKLVVTGTYWDSQIYSGELLLFGDNGTLHRVDWREVIDSLASNQPELQTAIRVAFSDSDLFYNPKVRKILRDPHIENPIKNQLSKLAVSGSEATPRTWQKQWRTEESPFKFLPTDTDIYYNYVFAGGDDGLFSIPRSKVTTSRAFQKSELAKHHDGRIFQVKASDSFTAVAAAGGDDGLLEFAFKRAESDVLDNFRFLAKRSCSACDWSFQSVIGWTSESAFLANFRQRKTEGSRKVERTFERIVEADEMFASPRSPNASGGFIWGCREKLYRISAGTIDVVNYSPKPSRQAKKTRASGEDTRQSAQFGPRKSVHLSFDASEAIATGTAPFGTVLEFADRLVVMRSDGEVEVFVGEPVQWRVFPRSEHYSNQLHIIYDDRLEIISFVHDYFVDQSQKLQGFARGSGELFEAALEDI